MLRKFKINVDGRIYNVAVEELGGDAPAAVPAPCAPSPVPPSPIPPAAPVAQPAVAPQVAAPAVPQAPVAPAASSSGFDVVAPLAGVIDSIEVRVGQTVAAGDKVAVVEAMKMKTEVFAKVAGTVQRILVKAHESVDTDQIILTIG
jgi:biotin carboxyl carrier protein